MSTNKTFDEVKKELKDLPLGDHKFTDIIKIITKINKTINYTQE